MLKVAGKNAQETVNERTVAIDDENYSDQRKLALPHEPYFIPEGCDVVVQNKC